MKPRLLLWLAASGSLVLALPACGGSGTDELPEVKSALARDQHPTVAAGDSEALVTGNTQFAADLYGQVKGEPGNLFLSPYSVSLALAMTYAGAAGTTATQMADAMDFTLPATQLHPAFNSLDLALASRGQTAQSDVIPFHLNVANSIWGQDGQHFESQFLDTLALNYGAGLHVLDFAHDAEGSRQAINGWVEDHTNDKIKDLIPQGGVNSSTKLVLTNAVYFTAAWAVPFEASATSDRPFHLASGDVSLPTMAASVEGSFGEGAGYQAAGLPYDGGELRMVVVVPDDLAAFEGSLTGSTFSTISDSLHGADVDLTLPKFKYTVPLDLTSPLQALGMTDAFTSAADFSGIDGQRDLLISAVVHKAYVAVDEKGTEAAAATAVIVGTTSVPELRTLHVDKPFVFYIEDLATHTILFVGRVADPRSDS